MRRLTSESGTFWLLGRHVLRWGSWPRLCSEAEAPCVFSGGKPPQEVAGPPEGWVCAHVWAPALEYSLGTSYFSLLESSPVAAKRPRRSLRPGGGTLPGPYALLRTCQGVKKRLRHAVGGGAKPSPYHAGGTHGNLGGETGPHTQRSKA